GTPADHSFAFVKQRVVADKKPAILTIVPQYTHFVLPRICSGKSFPACFAKTLQIFRMKNSLPEVAFHQLFYRETDVIDHSIIGIYNASVRTEHYNVMWNGIGDLLKIGL